MTSSLPPLPASTSVGIARCRRWAAVLIVALLVTGCGGGDKPKKKRETKPSKVVETPTPEDTNAAASQGLDPKISGPLGKLDSASATKRKEAIVALMKQKDAVIALKEKGTYSIVITGITGALKDSHWEVRSLAGIALLQIEGKDGVVFARQLLRDKNENVRTTIVNELGKLGKDYADDMVDALDDESEDIREIVLDHLTRMESKKAASRVISMLEKTENERVRAQILDYLLKTGTTTATTAVARIIDDLRNPNAVSRGVAYLGKYGTDTQVREDVVRFMIDDEILVRKAAVDAVVARKCRTVDSVAILINQLENEDEEVRALCHTALQKLTGQKFGFKPDAEDQATNQPAVVKWRKWLSDNESKLPQG